MIPHYKKYFSQLRGYACYKPWIILGKGSSFDNWLHMGDKTKFNVLTVNEVCTKAHSNIAFFLDVEPMNRSVRQMENANSVIFAPVRPHKEHKPVDKAAGYMFLCLLNNWFDTYSFDLARPQGDDLWGDRTPNFCESMEYEGEFALKSISNTFEAAFHMLCLSGVKEIYSLGIDGGFEYHPLFQTKEKPQSFNPNLTQFETVAKFASRYGVKYERL